MAWLRRYGSRLIALAFSMGITALIVVFRDRLLALQGLGYLGIFLISLLGTATVLFPVPGLAVVFAAGGVLNPLLVGLAAGIGAAIGELTAYLAGYAGNVVIENRERYERIRTWMARNGFLTLVVLAAIPNPMFDTAGIAAGMLRFPVPRFLLAGWLGQTIKALAVALLGALAVEWIRPLLY